MKINANKFLAVGLITISSIAATSQLSVNTPLLDYLSDKISTAQESAANIIVDYRHKNIIESINKLEQENPFIYMTSRLEGLKERAHNSNYRQLLKNSDFHAQECLVIEDMKSDYEQINSNPHIVDKDLKPKKLTTGQITPLKDKIDAIRQSITMIGANNKIKI